MLKYADTPLGTASMMSEALHTLRHSDFHTRKRYAIDARNNEVSPFSYWARRWSLMGAIWRASGRKDLWGDSNSGPICSLFMDDSGHLYFTLEDTMDEYEDDPDFGYLKLKEEDNLWDKLLVFNRRCYSYYNVTDFLVRAKKQAYNE